MPDLSQPQPPITLTSDLEAALASELEQQPAGIHEEGSDSKPWFDVTFDCFNTADTETY